jgi:[ribosomal protein S18]-alanine N-acetyltransferase
MGDEIPKIEIRRLGDREEAQVCARMMAASEPWITLRRDFEAALTILCDSGREVYVAAVDGQVVGFAILVMHGAFVGYVQSVGVAPAWRNRGVGRQLMAFVERRILAETPNVFICVSSFNDDARRLYERLGYHVVGELTDYIVAGHSEILLRKTVGPLSGFRAPGGHNSE